MSPEHSAEDLEAARTLRMLPHLIWEAQHPRPCNHHLHWGARRRRSAGTDDARPPPTHFPAAAAAPPHPPPPAPEKPNKSRSEDHAKPCPVAGVSVRKATAAAAVCSGSYPSVPETASPVTPLDFSRVGEEAKRSSHTKRLKSNHREQLAEHVDLLVRTRTELQKEAVESRNRLTAERWRYAELMELRVKLEEASYRRYQHHQKAQQQRLLFGRSGFDPVPQTCGVGSSTPRDRDGTLRRNRSQEVQHIRPQPWPHGCPVAGFSAPPRSTAPAGRAPQHCSLVAASHTPALDGGPGGSHRCKIPDLNARAEEDSP